MMGPGSLQSAGERIQHLGFKKALIVTDSGMSKSGAVNAVVDMLKSVGVDAVFFDKP